MTVSRIHWDDYKRMLPGYDAAMKERRQRAAGQIWESQEQIASELAGLTPEDLQQVFRKIRSMKERRDPRKPGDKKAG